MEVVHMSTFPNLSQYFNVLQDDLLDDDNDDSLFFLVRDREEDEQRGAEQVEEGQREEQQLQHQRQCQGRRIRRTEGSSTEEEVKPSQSRHFIFATRSVRGIHENDDGGETTFGIGQKTLGHQQCRSSHTGEIIVRQFSRRCSEIVIFLHRPKYARVKTSWYRPNKLSNLPDFRIREWRDDPDQWNLLCLAATTGKATL